MTLTLRLGTYVVPAGVREPVHLAADAATLDVLAPGRVLLGLGGHTPQEWLDVGWARPSPGSGRCGWRSQRSRWRGCCGGEGRHGRGASDLGFGAASEDLAGAPYLLIGTPRQMADQLRRQADRHGIARYVVREPAADLIAPALALLA